MSSNSFLFLFFVALYVNSQNLVPNASFEDIKSCPNFYDQFNKVRHWRNPTMASPDYYNKCADGTSFGTTTNGVGNQIPSSGNGYGGIIAEPTIQGKSDANRYQEYIQTKLKRPLIKDSLYCIKLNLSLADKSEYAIEYIGMAISKRRIGSLNKKMLNFKGEILKLKKNEYLDAKMNWETLSILFLAAGQEKFITIGNFDPIVKYKEVPIEKLYKSSFSKTISYYYIDDVSVIPINDSADCKCEQKKIISQPSEMRKMTSLQEQNFEIGEKFTIENIYFETAQSELLPQSYSELDKLSELFFKYPQLEVEISGHTDSTGNQNENLVLSEGRAKAVVEFLISKGISKEKLNFKGYGSNQPIATNETEEGRQQNRRVEFKILKK